MIFNHFSYLLAGKVPRPEHLPTHLIRSIDDESRWQSLNIPVSDRFSLPVDQGREGQASGERRLKLPDRLFSISGHREDHQPDVLVSSSNGLQGR